MAIIFTPEYCAECSCCDDCVEMCMAAEKEIREVNGECQKPSWCPLKSINPNLIKALHCIASQDSFNRCHMERYNLNRGDKPRMSCKPLPDDSIISCPYHQEEYGVGFRDGDCMEWLSELADMLEGVEKGNDKSRRD